MEETVTLCADPLVAVEAPETDDGEEEGGEDDDAVRDEEEGEVKVVDVCPVADLEGCFGGPAFEVGGGEGHGDVFEGLFDHGGGEEEVETVEGEGVGYFGEFCAEDVGAFEVEGGDFTCG